MNTHFDSIIYSIWLSQHSQYEVNVFYIYSPQPKNFLGGRGSKTFFSLHFPMVCKFSVPDVFYFLLLGEQGSVEFVAPFPFSIPCSL